MMIRINLLPHRQQKRALRQRRMMIACAASAALGLAVVGAGYTVMAGKVKEQEERNKFLEVETQKLDDQIDKIKDVKERTQDMLARKQIVEALQTNRSEAVHVLDQMVRQVPEGTWLKGIKQTDDLVNVTGYAQSNARVSTFMRNLESSQWLEKPELIEIKTTQVNNKRASEFSLNVRIKRPKVEENTASKGKTKPRPGEKSA
jgi:type IV pilus assembly protein PilN